MNEGGAVLYPSLSSIVQPGDGKPD